MLYLEPLAPNRDAFGFDVGSEPLRRHALEAGARYRRRRRHRAAPAGAGKGGAARLPRLRADLPRHARDASQSAAPRCAALPSPSFASAIWSPLRCSSARLQPLAVHPHRSRFRRADLRRAPPAIRPAGTARQASCSRSPAGAGGSSWQTRPPALAGWAPWAAFAGGPALHRAARRLALEEPAQRAPSSPAPMPRCSRKSPCASAPRPPRNRPIAPSRSFSPT